MLAVLWCQVFWSRPHWRRARGVTGEGFACLRLPVITEQKGAEESNQTSACQPAPATAPLWHPHSRGCLTSANASLLACAAEAQGGAGTHEAGAAGAAGAGLEHQVEHARAGCACYPWRQQPATSFNMASLTAVLVSLHLAHCSAWVSKLSSSSGGQRRQ